jgi:prepilin-type N-terminal cleavage/methylation domain-containing protein
MRNKNIKPKQADGFTIIEVLIVLAIAGLILLIVFLAVPALQRNAHNTSAKHDVSSILGAMNTYVNNNGGSLPTTVGEGSSTNIFKVSGDTGTNKATTKLGYFEPANVKLDSTSGDTGATAPNNTSDVLIVTGVKCNATGTAIDSSATSASARGYVALYTLQGGAKECTAS